MPDRSVRGLVRYKNGIPVGGKLVPALDSIFAVEMEWSASAALLAAFVVTVHYPTDSPQSHREQGISSPPWPYPAPGYGGRRRHPLC